MSPHSSVGGAGSAPEAVYFVDAFYDDEKRRADAAFEPPDYCDPVLDSIDQAFSHW